MEQYSFNAGELSPFLYGRVDIAKYASGCRTLENFVCLPHGPAARRPGLQFIAPVKVAGKYVRLVPFQVSTEQAYILEFGENYIRFYKEGGQIGAPYEVATNYLESDLTRMDFAQSADTLFIAHDRHVPAKLLRISDTNWVLSDILFISL